MKDFLARKTLAWETTLRFSRIWKSSLSRKLKLQFLKTTVETALFYGAVNWTLTRQLQRSLDRAYTTLLQYALYVPY